METYTYTPLNLEEPAFRLVRLFHGVGLQLQCEIIHAFLEPEDIVDYEAVSYTWGCVTYGIYFIEVHGETITKLSIGYNLYKLLLDLRHPSEDRILWIDAICINQDEKDTSERNHQVQQMVEIYRGAQRVLVWLGPSTHEMNLAMMFLVKVQTLYKDMKETTEEFQEWAREKFPAIGSPGHNNPTQLGLKQIFDHPWFRRIWILQEVGNARAALIHCGTKSVSSAVISLAPSILKIGIDLHCQAVLNLMPGSPARGKTGKTRRPRSNLRTLLRYFRDAEATHEHDKIYALLGLCSEEDRCLRVSYEKPISAVISEVISQVCHYEVTDTPKPLYDSIRSFQRDLDYLDERVICNLAINGYVNNLRCTMERQGTETEVTEMLMIASVSNRQKGSQLVDLIIEKTRNSTITDKVVLAAIQNEAQGKEILDIILPRAEEGVITEEVVLAAIANKTQGKEILDTILKQGRMIKVTERMVRAAILNKNIGREFLNATLAHQPRARIGEKVILAAIANASHGREFLNSMLVHAQNLTISEKVILAAIRQVNQSREFLNIMLVQENQIAITEGAVIAAIQGQRQGRGFRGGFRGIQPQLEESSIKELVTTGASDRAQHKAILGVIIPQDMEITADEVEVLAILVIGETGKLLDLVLQQAKKWVFTERVMLAILDCIRQHTWQIENAVEQVKGRAINTKVVSAAVLKDNGQFLGLISSTGRKHLVIGA
ncbi:heterokaryon incompatibility protein-domain-containing protein [Xylaria arbuscula]|nr:heterokaryon incompatibility protein-domain-containing protein [Xylaria arbuscula]